MALQDRAQLTSHQSPVPSRAHHTGLVSFPEGSLTQIFTHTVDWFLHSSQPRQLLLIQQGPADV